MDHTMRGTSNTEQLRRNGQQHSSAAKCSYVAQKRPIRPCNTIAIRNGQRPPNVALRLPSCDMDSTPTNPARRQIVVSILHAYQQHEEKYSQDLAVGQGNLSLQLQALIGQGLKKEFDDTLVARYVQPTATGPTPASLVVDLARQHPTHLVKLLNFSARHAAYMATRLPQPPSSSSAAAVEHGADDDDHPAQWAQRAGGSGCTSSSDVARAMAVHVRLHDMAAVQHSTMLLLARPAEQLVLIDALLQAQGLRACARALEAQRLEVQVQVQEAADAAAAGAADTATAVGEAAATAEALPLPSATAPPPPAAAPAVAPQQRPLDGQLLGVLERAAQLANGALTLCQQASGKLSLACKGAGSAELKVSTRMLQELADSQLGEHAAALALEVLGACSRSGIRSSDLSGRICRMLEANGTAAAINLNLRMMLGIAQRQRAMNSRARGGGGGGGGRGAGCPSQLQLAGPRQQFLLFADTVATLVAAGYGGGVRGTYGLPPELSAAIPVVDERDQYGGQQLLTRVFGRAVDLPIAQLSSWYQGSGLREPAGGGGAEAWWMPLSPSALCTLLLQLAEAAVASSTTERSRRKDGGGAGAGAGGSGGSGGGSSAPTVPAAGAVPLLLPYSSEAFRFALDALWQGRAVWIGPRRKMAEARSRGRSDSSQQQQCEQLAADTNSSSSAAGGQEERLRLQPRLPLRWWRVLVGLLRCHVLLSIAFGACGGTATKHAMPPEDTMYFLLRVPRDEDGVSQHSSTPGTLCGRPQLPPRPNPDMAAAVAAGLLPAVESVLRRPPELRAASDTHCCDATDVAVLGGLLQSERDVHPDHPWAGVLTAEANANMPGDACVAQLLAFAPPRQLSSLLHSLRKLLLLSVDSCVAVSVETVAEHLRRSGQVPVGMSVEQRATHIASTMLPYRLVPLGDFAKLVSGLCLSPGFWSDRLQPFGAAPSDGGGSSAGGGGGGAPGQRARLMLSHMLHVLLPGLVRAVAGTERFADMEARAQPAAATRHGARASSQQSQHFGTHQRALRCLVPWLAQSVGRWALAAAEADAGDSSSAASGRSGSSRGKGGGSSSNSSSSIGKGGGNSSGKGGGNSSGKGGSGAGGVPEAPRHYANPQAAAAAAASWQQLLTQEVDLMPVLEGMAKLVSAGSDAPRDFVEAAAVLLVGLASTQSGAAMIQTAMGKVGGPLGPRSKFVSALQSHPCAKAREAVRTRSLVALAAQALAALRQQPGPGAAAGSGSGGGLGPEAATAAREVLQAATTVPLLSPAEAWAEAEASASSAVASRTSKSRPAAAPPPPPPVLVRSCAHTGCTNVTGDSEAGLEAGLRHCAGCGAVAYCGRACQVAHWKEGHKETCGK